MLAVYAVCGDGGVGVGGCGSPEEGEGFGGEVGGDGSGDDGGGGGGGLCEGVGGEGEEAGEEEESQGWEEVRFLHGGNYTKYFVFANWGGFFWGGGGISGGAVGTGAGRGLNPRPERSTPAKYLPCFQIRKGIPAINLSNCFLSSVALLSRGWIVPVGDAIPDRLKDGTLQQCRLWNDGRQMPVGNDGRDLSMPTGAECVSPSAAWQTQYPE